MEIPLKDAYKYLEENITAKFKKERKNARKFISSTINDIKSMKKTLENINKGVDSGLEEGENSPSNLFIKAMVSEFDATVLSEDSAINYEVLKSIVVFWPYFKKKYHEYGKTFYGPDYNNFLLGLEMQIDKIIKSSGKLEKFLENKYEAVRDAESLKERLDELAEFQENQKQDIENLGPLKGKLQECEQKLQESKEKLAALQDDKSFATMTKILKRQDKIKQKIKSRLSKLKKTIKKFQNLLERDRFSPVNISRDDIEEYFTDMFGKLVEEGPEYPRFKIILENLVSCLNNEIKMKDDKKEKALTALTDILEENSLAPLITEFLEEKEKEADLSKSMKGDGLLGGIEQMKNDVYHLTNQKAEIEDDIEKEKKNLENTIEEKKSLKEELEAEMTELSGEEITILLN